MATGDVNDVATRIKALLPPWFGDDDPVLDSLIAGFATALAFVYSLVAYAALQTRLATMTDGWLDLFAADFFGSTTKRAPNQSDGSFRTTIAANLFRERATRPGMVRALTDLTGQAPTIFEPRRPLDTGTYGGSYGGYGVAGGYGSLLLPYQAFITVKRPLASGIANVAGYGISTAGYGQASQAEYASLSMIETPVTDADIYATIDAVKPVGTIMWTRIANAD